MRPATSVIRTNQRRCRLVAIPALIVVICAGGFAGPFPRAATPDDSALDSAGATRSPLLFTGEPPQKARELLAELEARQGVPLPGYVGGREFKNRERRLPRGLYREYDVNPMVRGRPRDAERIVIEQRTGKAYYTVDHYRTFVPLN